MLEVGTAGEGYDGGQGVRGELSSGRGLLKRRLRVWVLVTLVQGVVFLSGTLYIEYGTDHIGVWDEGFGAILLFSIAVLVPLMVSTPISALFSLYYALRLKLYRRDKDDM